MYLYILDVESFNLQVYKIIFINIYVEIDVFNKIHNLVLQHILKKKLFDKIGNKVCMQRFFCNEN